MTYELHVEPSRNIPTFEMPATFATLESSGPQEAIRFVEHISAGPALEFLQVVDNSFVISYQAPWFSQPPNISRDGTLQFQLAPNVFGLTEIHVSLTARSIDGTSYRTNTQHFNLGKRVPEPATPYAPTAQTHDGLTYARTPYRLHYRDRCLERCSVILPQPVAQHYRRVRGRVQCANSVHSAALGHACTAWWFVTQPILAL